MDLSRRCGRSAGRTNCSTAANVFSTALPPAAIALSAPAVSTATSFPATGASSEESVALLEDLLCLVGVASSFSAELGTLPADLILCLEGVNGRFSADTDVLTDAVLLLGGVTGASLSPANSVSLSPRPLMAAMEKQVSAREYWCNLYKQVFTNNFYSPVDEIFSV